MRRLRSAPIIATAGLLLTLAAVPAAAPGATLHVGPGQTYATIQAAVDDAGPGDEIVVHDGTYVENVLVDRPVAIRSQDYLLNGENDGAVVDASGLARDYGFEIQADGVVIEGFSVHGAVGYSMTGLRAGIMLDGCHGCTVTHNRCGWEESHNNSVGILVTEGGPHQIIGNEAAWNQHGISLERTSGNTVSGNSCHDNFWVTWSSGITMSGDLDPIWGTPTMHDNLLQNNDLRGNSVGACLYFACVSNVVRGNTIDANYSGVIVWSYCWHNLIAGNTVTNSVNRGIQVNAGRENVIADNTIDNNVNGIWFGFLSLSDYGSIDNLVTGNSILNNGYAGIRISASSPGNRMFMNQFRLNAANVISEGTDWSTAVPVSYFHGGNWHGQLGNYYDTYAGIDTDGDGIGDTDLPFTDGDPLHGPVEHHPLVVPPGTFELQAWYLRGAEPLTMRRDDALSVMSSVEIPGGESRIWVSEAPAAGQVVFPAGAWTGQVSFAEWPPADACLVEIGVSTDGTDFTPSGAEATVGDAMVVTFTTPVAGITVANRERLAVRVTSLQGDWPVKLLAGGAACFVSSPGNGDPEWPNGTGTAAPDLPAAAHRLEPNVPNPFNPMTAIRYELAAPAVVTLRIHDLRGRLVRTLMAGRHLAAGPHRTLWDGRDDAGREAPSGVYFCRLAAGRMRLTRKLDLVR